MSVQLRPRRFRQNARVTSLLLCLVVPLLPGCVSELADNSPVDPKIVKEEIRVAESDQNGRLLISLDKRVGEYHYLNAQPGPQAREQREDVESLLRATVAQNLPLMLNRASQVEKPLAQMIAVKALGFTADVLDQVKRPLGTAPPPEAEKDVAAA